MTLEEKVKAICPQCKEERTFVKAETLPTDSIVLYSCELCKIRVSTTYLSSPAFQKVFGNKNGRQNNTKHQTY